MLKRIEADFKTLNEFLRVKTPDLWLDYARSNIPLLLIDHAHCERKAATTAINFISKYPTRKALIDVMSPLAREELLHFEKVIAHLSSRNIDFIPLKPSEYAVKLHQHITKAEGSVRLSDQLIVGAIIEARSCERFYSLLSVLDDVILIKFYQTLVQSEARHFQQYLRLAKLYGGDIEFQLQKFLNIENNFIASNDEVFRFHSGIPIIKN